MTLTTIDSTGGSAARSVTAGLTKQGIDVRGKVIEGLLIASLAAAGTIDPARVCLLGASYGGYAALWGAIREPARYRCAASFAGVTASNGAP